MECTLSQERISVWSIQHSFLVLIRCFVPSVWTKTIKTKARESERFHEPFYHNARIIRDINISSSSRAYQLTTGYSRKWLTRTVCETREGGIALNIGFRVTHGYVASYSSTVSYTVCQPIFSDIWYAQ